MSRSVAASPALPIAHTALRGLIVLNWMGGVLILALLVVSTHTPWIMQAFKLLPSREADTLVMGMRAIAGLGLVAIPLNYLVFKRLLAIVETVRDGEPFVTLNADRLRAIAAVLLTFVLARVFEEGTLMREDLEGTV